MSPAVSFPFLTAHTNKKKLHFINGDALHQLLQYIVHIVVNGFTFLLSDTHDKRQSNNNTLDIFILIQ